MAFDSFATDAMRCPPVKHAPGSAEDIVAKIGEVAALVADCSDLEPRDRNAAIGQLRATAAMVRGCPGLPGYRQAPFAPTTKAP